jgi:Mrp family chromosome partitioning ATPase
VDGVLLVVTPGVTRSTALRQMVEQFRRVNANILGIVFNNLDLHSSRYAHRYYYYRGYYHNKYHKYYAPEPNGHSDKKKVKTPAHETEEV